MVEALAAAQHVMAILVAHLTSGLVVAALPIVVGAMTAVVPLATTPTRSAMTATTSAISVMRGSVDR